MKFTEWQLKFTYVVVLKSIYILPLRQLFCLFSLVRADRKVPRLNDILESAKTTKTYC